jgi:uncharacterized protein (TIRG00374 family)
MTLVRSAGGSVWVRAAGSVLLLGFVAINIDLGAAADRLREGRWEWFAVAVALLLVALGIGAWRWHVLLAAAGISSTRRETLRAFAIGVFCTTFLPTSFGGDGVRAWIVGRPRGAVVRALTSVGVDRATALACLVAVGWLLAALNPGAVPGSLALALLVASVAGAGVVGVLSAALVRPGSWLRRLPTWLARRHEARAARLTAWAQEGRGVLRAYVRSRRVVWAVVGLGCAYQLVAVAFLWALTRVVQVDLAPSTVAVALPLIVLANLIPLSIAGFGVREGAFVVVLGTADVTATDATVLSLLTITALALSGMPGALALLARGEMPPRPDLPSHPPRREARAAAATPL